MSEDKSSIIMDVVLERDYFLHVAFTYDLLSYCMTELGHPWVLPLFESLEDYRSNKRFNPLVGHAVLKYQERHARDIIREINDLRPRGPMKDIMLTIAFVTFKQESYLKEFFKFCAQIVSVGLEFMERGQSWQLELMVAQIDGVYHAFLKRKLINIGGWNVLQRYAVRYCIYGD